MIYAFGNKLFPADDTITRTIIAHSGVVTRVAEEGTGPTYPRASADNKKSTKAPAATLKSNARAARNAPLW